MVVIWHPPPPVISMADAAVGFPMSLVGKATDFDFFFGTWAVSHRRLKERLASCEQWEEFAGTCVAHPILGGAGNIDDNVVELPGGTYRASTIRSFDPTTATWAIWWLDQRNPHSFDVPVIGTFHEGRGEFYATDTLNDAPITVRFVWSETSTPSPRWEQAFSPDAGATWETNWTMQFVRSS
jgi:hypothetical protein